jgi:aspartate kinase
VVVVSAMGRVGEPYATDTLIGLAKHVNPELDLAVPSRELDLLISCGEVISTVVMVQALASVGVPATALTGGQAGIITDAAHGEASILGINPVPIRSRLSQGLVVVVAGFQGMTEAGDVTTLGRGGSDTTATALGAGLDAEFVEIYTDVEGVMTVDPRLVPDAKMLSTMSYEELCELAHAGAKVVHPRAVEIARDRKIPVRVRSTFSDAAGTLVVGDDQKRVITGIAHMAGLSKIDVALAKAWTAAHKVGVLRTLADAGINIDFVSAATDGLSFTVAALAAETAVSLLCEAGFAAFATPGCAKVTMVGVGMQAVPGVALAMLEALEKAGVAVLQTVDSEITMSCLVLEADMQKAVRALHDAFGLARAQG